MAKKILIAGIGGIGGLMAGQLIKKYRGAVTLIARGARAESLKKDGLVMKSDCYGRFTEFPEHITEKAEEKADFVIISVKNGQIPTIAECVKDAIGPDTVVMPIMNGVRAADKLEAVLPPCHMMTSVIYTVSKSEPDFAIRQLGDFTFMHTGPAGSSRGNAGSDSFALEKEFNQLLVDAGIDATYHDDPYPAVWEKYILNCAYNVSSARWGTTMGAIRSDEKLRTEYRALLQEAYDVAKARGVAVDDDVVEKHMYRLLNTYTEDSDSSLSRDYDNHNPGEGAVFCQELIDMGAEAGVPTPTMEEYWAAMQAKVASWK